MKSFTFHGNQIYVERETGLEPATPCLEGVVAAEPHFPKPLNLKSRREPPLFPTSQMTDFSLPPATYLTDFTILTAGQQLPVLFRNQKTIPLSFNMVLCGHNGVSTGLLL